MRQYDFSKQSAQKIMRQIVQYVKRAQGGRTLAQISAALSMSPSGVSPYVVRLCDDKVIHIAQEHQATQRGHIPAIYKIGAMQFIDRRRKPAYMNDPLLAHFFGSNFNAK